VESVFLDCGRLTAQLMRDSLGCRHGSVLATLLLPSPTGRPYGKAPQGSRLASLLLSPRANGAGGSLSEAHVKRGRRIVHGDKELSEKLGRNDPCPCDSGRRFQALLYELWPI
jgi:hypothetical protein